MRRYLPVRFWIGVHAGLDPNSNVNINNVKCSPLPLPPRQHPQRQQQSLPAPSFVVVSVLSSRQQTPMANCTLNSTYTAKDATFDFPIYLSLADKLSVVELVVWDNKDMLLKEYLGKVALPLDDWFLDMVSSKLGAVNFCLLFFFFVISKTFLEHSEFCQYHCSEPNYGSIGGRKDGSLCYIGD